MCIAKARQVVHTLNEKLQIILEKLVCKLQIIQCFFKNEFILVTGKTYMKFTLCLLQLTVET